ncbi:MAG: hypothetical protein O2960_28090 [Verrucomicrobia bacterium]|nr:hypothetical protein [Verrucomicrobiota bacterium]
MSKYTFERLGADRFETLAQALLEKLFRVTGSLVQFGDGKDGAREATWTQPVDHPTYKRPPSADSDVPKEWVFQAKYHDIGTRGWAGARAEVESELDNELDKIVNKYKVPCHKYVLITNVPFSGVRHVGTRDKVNKVIKKWQENVPEIEVWDAIDLSRMLDADPDTRTTYLDAILPGDVLRAFLTNVNFTADRRKSAFHAYLKSILRSERDAKAEEAGDESGLQLEKIFVDLDLKLITESLHDFAAPLVQELKHSAKQGDETVRHIPANLERVPSSFAFLRADHRSMLLKGGPGVGKSTITQFLTLYHAARLVERPLSLQLVRRLKLTGGVSAEELDAHSRVRFPLRVELRRYAQWMSDPKKATADTFLARYLAERIGQASSADLTMDDIFALASENPLLLIFDGLDEVPHPDLRGTIFNELVTFLDRCEGESCDIQLILSSRPQGYRGEFDGFAPIEWHVVDLDRGDFEDYAQRWLNERISDGDERNDARQRIDDGMQAPAVQQMATTLLQATVMLTIARRKHAIPHARHKLYEKYVEVIFERERNKQTVRKHGDELLKLHELVGFELIRKMETATGVRTLRGEEFKQCVQQVIEDYGPTDLGEVTIGRVVEEIVTLAKDRLCLLAGKGEDQEDVDFAIQQFREYFAAAHLARHEDADPERVYACLIDRRHIWAQVLQFYTAFQSKAQQKNWISEADGTDTGQGQYDGIVKMTRNRRALLRVLPEFERPKNEYIQRPFRNIFDTPTRWTWRDREDTARLLNAFAPDEAFGTLRQLFEHLSIDVAPDLHVELDLLAKSAGPANKSTVRQLLANCLADERCRSVVLEIAYSNDVEVDFTDCPIEAIGGVLHFRPDFHEHRCPNFLNKLSKDQVLDLMFLGRGGHVLWQSEVTSKQWFRDLWQCFSPDHPEFGMLRLGCVMSPFMLDRKELVSAELLSRMEQSRAGVAPYLAALLRAIGNPLDANCFEEAKVQQAASQSQIMDFLTVEFQLGPEPAEFSTTEEWAAARNEVFAAAKKVRNLWLSKISDDDASWITLFVHADAWPMLHPIIPKERLELLIGECQSAVKSLSPKSAIPIQIHSYRRQQDLALFQLCNFVLGIVKKHGSRSVRNDARVVAALVGSPIRGVDSNAAEKLLQEAIELGSEVPSFWAGLIVRVCSAVHGVSLDRLFTFWQRHWSRDLLWINNVQEPHETLIEEALDLGTNDGVSFAAFLASTQRHPPGRQISSQLAERITHSLCDSINAASGDERSMKVQLLLQQALDPRELNTWANPEIVNAIRGEPWQLDRLAGRLKEMVNVRAGFDEEQLRQQLGVFVERRLEFPVEVSLAALEAILRIDEIMATPLSDNDWQR